MKPSVLKQVKGRKWICEGWNFIYFFHSLTYQSKVALSVTFIFTFTFMHLADAFIQSELQSIQAIYFLSVCVFPGSYIQLPVWCGRHTVHFGKCKWTYDSQQDIFMRCRWPHQPKDNLTTMLFAFLHSASVVPGFYIPRFSLDDKIMGQFSTSEHDFRAQLSCLRLLL